MQEEFWEDNNPALKYSGGQWARAYGSIYHGSAVMRTRHIGASMSLTFRGSAIKFMGAQGWDHGSFRVVLDGEETIVDGHCCAPNGGVPQVIQFEATGLGTSEHVLNITNLAAGPRGTVLEVDALIVTPQAMAQNTSHLSLLLLLIVLAFVFAAVRRRLVRLANKTSYQMLPVAAPEHPEPSALTMLPPPNRVRTGKQHPYPDDDVHSLAGGSAASGSGSGSGDAHQKHMPPQYAPSPEVDDALVERIAQRLARLVRDDAPPTYENTTASPASNECSL
ncbi:hypothetical protein FB451DRAFT_1239357 [Mycena latifolia]|nr:hypothetical protein FB451DRAFT_1239357 [Mycena latifolia]